MSELPASDEGIEILSPTEEAYGSFYEAYRIFNTALFEDDLPGLLDHHATVETELGLLRRRAVQASAGKRDR
jgi:hypothetical protein